MKRLFALVIFTTLLALAGCKKNLYSGLSEHDVNIMIAILEQNGITAERNKDGDNKYTLKVDEEDFTKSVTVLSAKGYPKKKFQSLADVFSNEGIVKTPFEQRARFIHALNQELSRSISDIDGVISARVHITQPEVSRFGKTAEKPRAAVVILHYPSKSMNGMKPKIKQLVAHSVNGMTYENVTVVMSPVNGVDSRSDTLDNSSSSQFIASKVSDESEKSDKATTASRAKQENTTYIGSFFYFGSAGKTILLWLLMAAGTFLAAASIYLWRKASRHDNQS